MLTEWQQYLTQCIETIALVAEVRPLQVFEQVVSKIELHLQALYHFPTLFEISVLRMASTFRNFRVAGKVNRSKWCSHHR